MLLPNDNCEIYIEPQLDTIYAPGQPVGYSLDYSGKNRTVVADPNFPASYPYYSESAINGKAAVSWLGTQNPLKNSSVFQVHCGWIVAKVIGSTFTNYNGLLTDTDTLGVLVGNGNGSTEFFDFGTESYEFRSADRIYQHSNQPAPMNVWRTLFFRFWEPVTFNGVQLGQDRMLVNRKYNGSVALLALYSRNFLENEIRKYSKIISDNFALNLADVYPYQADINDVAENLVQKVNFYDPPEGDRISEVLGNSKRIFDLRFSNADQQEFKTMRKYHAEHYAPAVPCIFRDYKITPPEDIEGYIDSEYEADGANDNFNYSFRFKER